MICDSPGSFGLKGSFFLLSAILLLSAVGCHSPSGFGAQRSVNIQALLPLHPAYALTEGRVDAISPPSVLKAGNYPFPPLQPHIDLPNLTSSSTFRVPTQRISPEIQLQKVDALKKSNIRILEREEQFLQRKLQEDMKAEELKSTEKLFEQRNIRLKASMGRLSSLMLKEQIEAIALRSSTGAAFDDSHLLDLRDQIEVEKSLQRAEQRDLKLLASQQCAPIRKAYETRILEQIATRRIELDDKVEAYQKELVRLAKPSRVSKADSTTLVVLNPTVTPSSTTKMRSISTVRFGLLPNSSMSQPNPAAASDPKLRLRERILKDTQESVKAIAARHHWKIVESGTRGSKDVTEEVRLELQKLWRE